MAIRYNKEIIKKDRRVMPSGPRDRQLKQQLQNQITVDNSGLIQELRNQIVSLQDRLASAKIGGYTADQVNEAVINAVTSETAAYKQKIEEYKGRVAFLDQELNHTKVKLALAEKDIANLNERLSEKIKHIEVLEEQKPTTDNNVTALLAEATKKIEALSLQVQNSTGQAVPVDPDRPQMETVFVDPTDREANVEKHFNVEVEDRSSDKREEVANKVNKLKNLLGKMPQKR